MRTFYGKTIIMLIDYIGITAGSIQISVEIFPVDILIDNRDMLR